MKLAFHCSDDILGYPMCVYILNPCHSFNKETEGILFGAAVSRKIWGLKYRALSLAPKDKDLLGPDMDLCKLKEIRVLISRSGIWS